MPTRWTHDDARWLKADRWFAAVFLALFAYAVLDWRGLLGGEPPTRPLQMVLLAGGLLLQPLASLARARSAALFWLLALASVAAIVCGVLAR